MASTEAVLLDLDNTICRYRRTDAELLALAFEEAGVEPFFEPPDYHDVIPKHIDRADDAPELRRRCFRELAERDGRDPGVGEAVAERYTANRSPDGVEFLGNAETVLAELADRYRLGLVTNGERRAQATKLRTLGVEDLFEVVVYAGDDVPAKPDPEPYRVALDAMDVECEQAVYVGDSLDSDVAGANAAGLTSVWLEGDDEPAGDARPAFTVSSLDDLPSLSCL